tara:strand:- start:120 stop:332 length:213 start_codon:yes stop_codon:yes gene_type:complete
LRQALTKNAEFLTVTIKPIVRTVVMTRTATIVIIIVVVIIVVVITGGFAGWRLFNTDGWPDQIWEHRSEA